MNPKYILFFPFISSLTIVLNLYNGDILGISCNFEYLQWYIPPLFILSYFSYNENNIRKYIIEILVCLAAIIFNIYWHYAWIEDEKTNYRHRTEYYDTQALLSAFLFIILFYEFKTSKKTNITYV